MKKILVFGDSNTWGFNPGSFDATTNTASRYPKDQRWGGVLGHALGASYEVIEEGLNGRTAVLDDPYLPIMTNGKAYLLPCLLSHSPLDLVIIKLGTNELKARFNLSASEIAKGIRQLIWLIRSLNIGTVNKSPEIIIISPCVVIDGIGPWKDEFVGAEDKSQALAVHYNNICQMEKCHFLDANHFCKSSAVDGIHLDSENQVILGKKVAELVKHIFRPASHK